MKRLSLKQIIYLHSILITQTGGVDGVRDNRLLESAISVPFQTFDSEYLYSTPQERAARLGYGIIKNHPFIDGNKRIGLLVMILFLELNRVFLIYSDNEMIKLGLTLADGTTSFNDLIKWILQHM